MSSRKAAKLLHNPSQALHSNPTRLKPASAVFLPGQNKYGIYPPLTAKANSVGQFCYSTE